MKHFGRPCYRSFAVVDDCPLEPTVFIVDSEPHHLLIDEYEAKRWFLLETPHYPVVGFEDSIYFIRVACPQVFDELCIENEVRVCSPLDDMMIEQWNVCWKND